MRGGYGGRGRGGDNAFATQGNGNGSAGRGWNNGFVAAAPQQQQQQQVYTPQQVGAPQAFQQAQYAQPAQQGRGGGRGGGGGQAHQTYPVQPQQQQQLAAPQPTAAKVNPNSRTTSTTRAEMTQDRFDSLPISATMKRAVADVLCYEVMTRVQAMTINVSMQGHDMLAKAKTGTGKTLAFLIPTLARVEGIPHNQRKGGTSLLIVSPTRELAQQIYDEGKQVMTYMHLHAMVVFGGTPIRSDNSALRRQQPDMLVATPGRLNDLLENHGQRHHMTQLKCLVFDEADQLLEMGFRPEITKMLAMLPSKETRQTLLFSATMPDDVMHIARFALRDNFQHVDCVGTSQDTHQHVAQSCSVHPMEEQFAHLLLCLREAMEMDKDFKILVFFTTAKMTQMASELFNAMGIPVLEMHSRKTQPQRTATSAKFREQHRVIMFTSDVTARGMDYPDVSRVVQVGLPSDKAQYTHRLGRTARAGKNGDGVLLLCDFEGNFVRQLADQKIQTRRQHTRQELAAVQPNIDNCLRRMNKRTLFSAYQAWLGFYNSNLKKLGWSKAHCVAEANRWITECCHMDEPPALPKRTVGMMNLKDVPGIRIETNPSGGGGGGGGKGMGGGGKGKGGGGGKGGKGGGRGHGRGATGAGKAW